RAVTIPRSRRDVVPDARLPFADAMAHTGIRQRDVAVHSARTTKPPSAAAPGGSWVGFGYPICADISGNILVTSSRQLFHAWIPNGGNEYTALPPPKVAIRTWNDRVFASASASSTMPLKVAKLGGSEELGRPLAAATQIL